VFAVKRLEHREHLEPCAYRRNRRAADAPVWERL